MATFSKQRDQVHYPIEGPVLVGVQFNVIGGFAAECEEKYPNFLSSNDNDHQPGHYGCHRERADLHVRCSGACKVDGTKVTALGEGPLFITVEMDSGDHRSVQNLTVEVAMPERIEVSGCADAGPCLLTDGEIKAQVYSHDRAFTGQLQLNVAGVSTTFVCSVSIASVLGGRVAPGFYPIELRYGSIEKTLVVEIPTAMSAPKKRWWVSC
jgi:hypothetical protein